MTLRPSAAGADVRKFQLIAAGLVVLAAVGLAAIALSRDARRLAATNNVPTNGMAAEIAPGDSLCRAHVPTPAGSAGVRAFVVPRPGTGTNSSLAAVLRIDGVVAGRGVGSREGTGILVVPFTREVSRGGSGTVCFTNVGDRSIVGFGGTSRDRAADSPLRVEGKRVPADVSVDVVLPKESLFSAIDRAAHRATVWAPSWVGGWTLYVVVALSIGLLALGVTLTVGRRPGRRDVWAIAAIAFVGGIGWAAILPPWQGPDEINHFSYVQYLAETGDLPGRPGAIEYSKEHQYAMEQSFTNSVRQNAQAKPPWEDSAFDRWDALQKKTGASSSDGGGVSTASPYPPPYYGLAAVGYKAFEGGTIFDRLFGSRLLAALLGALSVLCVWLFARELFGRPGILPNTAALSVALLPQFQFISGITNNDSLLILMGSLELYLIARVIRRGVTPRTAVAMGAVLALGYLTKPTMVAFAPAVAVVLAWPLLCERRLAALRPALIGFAGFLAVWVTWGAIAALAGRELWPTEASGAQAFVPSDFLNYLWSFYLPSPPGVVDHYFAGLRPPVYTVWMHSFFAAFGWNDTVFPEPVYEVITGICIALGVLLVVAAWRERAALWRSLGIVAAGAVTTIVLLVFVHLAFYLYYSGFPGGAGPLPAASRPAVRCGRGRQQPRRRPPVGAGAVHAVRDGARVPGDVFVRPCDGALLHVTGGDPLYTAPRLEARTPSAAPSREQDLRAEIHRLVAEHFRDIPPLPDDTCPLSVPLYGAEEVCGALDALLDQQVTAGRRVREFEQKFADFIGSRHAVMVNSGSSANLLALSVLAHGSLPGGLSPGDEVIVPAVAWSTTLAPILQIGCVPVLVDIDPDTLNLRADDLADAISPRTRGIMPVHLLGNPVDMEKVMDFARPRNLWVVEDTCESLGSSIGARKVGSFGDFGTFSFYFSHHITTIEGGMLITDNDRLADLARSIRAHGWTRDMSNREELERANPWVDPRFLFVNVGYNLRPTEVNAAFGLVQLERLEDFNERRRENARYLVDALSGLSHSMRFVSEQEGGRSTWFGFTVMLPDGDTRRALSRHLEARRIETRPIVAGNLAVQPAFRDNPHRTVGSLANATEVGERGLFIGNHPNLTRGHLDHIVTAFMDFFDS